MTYTLKRDLEPVWLEAIPLDDTSSVISLIGGDGGQVAVPAVLLLASSPLVRAVLSTDHCPPAYVHPMISLPSVSGDVLQFVGTMLAAGRAVVTKRMKVKVLEVFEILRIEPCVIDLQVRIDSSTNLVQNIKKEAIQIEKLTDEFEIDGKEKVTIKIEFDNNDTEVSHAGQCVTDKTVEAEQPVKEDAVKVLKLRVNIQKYKITSAEVASDPGVTNLWKESEAEVQFCCDHCPKKYTKKSNLLRHIQVVHEKKTFNCTLCNQKFRDNSDVKQHMLAVHEKITFDCHLCDNKFRYKSTLTVHILAVHDKTSFNCHLCYNKFNRKSNLRYHILTVHEKMNLNCHLCDKIFNHKAHLRRHILLKHGDSRV